MKLWKLLAIALAAAVLFGAVISPWLVPQSLLRAAIADRIEAAIGVRPVILGPVSLNLFPTPHVTAFDIRIDGATDGTPLMKAAQVDGELRPQNLIVGQIETGTITITGAQFTQGPAVDSARSWLTLLAGREGQPSTALGRIRILSSALTVDDDSDQGRKILTIDDLMVSWPKRNATATLRGDINIRGQVVTIDVEATKPSDLLAGGASPLSMGLKSANFNLSLSGNMFTTNGPRVEATLTVSTKSLRDTLKWMGAALLPGETMGAGQLQAEAVLTPTVLSFTQATLALDGNQAEGALEVNLSSERIAVTGTLAADAIDLSRYANDVSLIESGSRSWREDRIEAEAFDRMDLDVRFSANDVTFGRAKIGRCAVAVAIRDGELEVTLGEAVLYGGVFSGQLKLSRASQDAMKLVAGVSYTDIDLSGVLEGFFALNRWDGKGSGTAEVQGLGSTVKEIVASLAGSGHVSAVDGALVGIDVEDTLRRIQRRPLSTRLSADGGKTPFQKAAASFTLADGVARSSDILLEHDNLRISLGGDAILPQQQLRLSGDASLVERGSAEAEIPKATFVLPISIEGTFDRPRIEADPRALIRQSGAAAPLLPNPAPLSTPSP